MTGLLASELRRLTSRRLVRVMLLVSVALVLVLNVLVAVNSNPDRIGESMETIDIWLTTRTAAELGVARSDLVMPTISVLTFLLVIVIGASAVGAEYRAGTVTTVLTWEPRRVRFMVARFLAIALVAMAFYLVVLLVFVGTWHIGAALNGTTAGANAEFWRDVAAALGRSTLVAGGLAVLSGAIATVGRNTAAAMGVWFGYLVVVEGIVRANFDELVPWFLTANIASFYGWETVRSEGHTIEAGTAAVRLLLYLALIGAGAVAVFRRRDVT